MTDLTVRVGCYLLELHLIFCVPVQENNYRIVCCMEIQICMGSEVELGALSESRSWKPGHILPGMDKQDNCVIFEVLTGLGRIS